MNILSVDVSEPDLTVIHRFRGSLFAIGVDRLEPSASDHHVKVIGGMAVQTGALSGSEAKIPDAHALVFKEKFRADLRRDGWVL